MAQSDAGARIQPRRHPRPGSGPAAARVAPALEIEQFRARQTLEALQLGILLQDVADVFHTDLVLPRHFEVANAVGAIAGSVVVNEEILVYPRLSQEGLEV